MDSRWHRAARTEKSRYGDTKILSIVSNAVDLCYFISLYYNSNVNIYIRVLYCTQQYHHRDQYVDKSNRSQQDTKNIIIKNERNVKHFSPHTKGITLQ